MIDMPKGPGKYDELATHVREASKAKGVIVIVIGGEKGSGFSVQAEANFLTPSLITSILRKTADDIDTTTALEELEPKAG